MIVRGGFYEIVNVDGDYLISTKDLAEFFSEDMDFVHVALNINKHNKMFYNDSVLIGKDMIEKLLNSLKTFSLDENIF